MMTLAGHGKYKTSNGKAVVINGAEIELFDDKIGNEGEARAAMGAPAVANPQSDDEPALVSGDGGGSGGGSDGGGGGEDTHLAVQASTVGAVSNADGPEDGAAAATVAGEEAAAPQAFNRRTSKVLFEEVYYNDEEGSYVTRR